MFSDAVHIISDVTDEGRPESRPPMKSLPQTYVWFYRQLSGCDPYELIMMSSHLKHKPTKQGGSFNTELLLKYISKQQVTVVMGKLGTASPFVDKPMQIQRTF